MKRPQVAICIILASACFPLAIAQNTGSKEKSSERAAALKKCNDDYKDAAKAANVLKGRQRSDALKVAEKVRNDCRTNANSAREH
jgi:hypothetical protein